MTDGGSKNQHQKNDEPIHWLPDKFCVDEFHFVVPRGTQEKTAELCRLCLTCKVRLRETQHEKTDCRNQSYGDPVFHVDVNDVSVHAGSLSWENPSKTRLEQDNYKMNNTYELQAFSATR